MLYNGEVMHFKRGTSLKFQEAETALAELKEQVCVCCLLCIFSNSFFFLFLIVLLVAFLGLTVFKCNF